jgi:hypothetical protein
MNLIIIGKINNFLHPYLYSNFFIPNLIANFINFPFKFIHIFLFGYPYQWPSINTLLSLDIVNIFKLYHSFTSVYDNKLNIQWLPYKAVSLTLIGFHQRWQACLSLASIEDNKLVFYFTFFFHLFLNHFHFYMLPSFLIYPLYYPFWIP